MTAVQSLSITPYFRDWRKIPVVIDDNSGTSSFKILQVILSPAGC